VDRKLIDRTPLIAIAALLATFLVSIATSAATPPAGTPTAATSGKSASEVLAQITDEEGVLRFDVAEDGTRFLFAPEPVFEDGMPAYGNPFITQGYIYPAGTLTESNGVLPDGSPEFPDLVLGEWTCRGWFVGEGAHATTGAWVITTQVYNFGSEVGDVMLIAEGYEVADIGIPSERAITGGTGPFSIARGEGTQTLLGYNPTMGVNLTMEFAPTN